MPYKKNIGNSPFRDTTTNNYTNDIARGKVNKREERGIKGIQQNSFKKLDLLYLEQHKQTRFLGTKNPVLLDTQMENQKFKLQDLSRLISHISER